MRRQPATALLIDFDGVLRHYDGVASAAVEARHRLEPGALLTTGLEWSRYLPVVTGRWTRRQWLDAIAEATGASRSALSEWDADPGYVDVEVLAFVRRVRAAGRPVALATNATDELNDELARLNLQGEFDAVVNSAELGWHKPTREFYAAACAAVETPAKQCLLVDDTARNVSGARVCGLPALRWNGPGDLRYLAAALGLPSVADRAC